MPRELRESAGKVIFSHSVMLTIAHKIAIDNQIIKPLNFIISYHTADLKELAEITDVKLMSLELIEVCFC